MKFIVGKKIEMTQVWKNDKVVAVTKVQAGPCVISQVKNQDKDGYQAFQVAFGERKEKRISKPQKNHFKKAGLKSAAVVKEFRVEAVSDVKTGDVIKVDTFSEGDKVEVSGVSKGKGFAGVVKRHGFSGSKKTHGNKDQLRMPGSAGATGPAHVFKGTRMGGRMGGDNVTTKNLEIVEIDQENNILLIKGSVPGSRNSFVFIVGDGDLKVEKSQEKTPEEASKETEIKTEEKEPETVKETTSADDQVNKEEK